jgi:uncharacterized protein DUF2782
MGIFPVSRVSVFSSRALLILAMFMTAILLFLSTTSATAAENDITLQGPDVVIIAGEDKVIYEFRQNGELRMVRVVPTWGKPYYLVPRDNTAGFGNLERADMLLPQWIIAEF